MSIAEWIMQEAIQGAKNKSQRVEELIIKGYMAEREQELKKLSSGKESSPARNWTSPNFFDNLNPFVADAPYLKISLD